MTAPRKPRRVRVWACIGPRGRVVYASTRRIVCSAVLVEETHRRYGDANGDTLRAMRREGWRVRRLAPKEVQP